MKAVRSLEMNLDSLESPFVVGYDKAGLMQRILEQDDERLFLIAQAIRTGVSLEEIHELTKIDYFFLNKIRRIVELEEQLKSTKAEELDKKTLLTAKRMGFGDKAMARFLGITEPEM